MIWLVTLLLALIGQVMVWRGLIGDRAKGRPHCWKCRYDMSGGDPANLTCPECGHVNKNRAKLFKTRRYYGRFLVGAILMAAALYCHTAPQVQFRRGELGEAWWESVVPTWTWIAMLPELDEERIAFVDRRIRPPEVGGAAWSPPPRFKMRPIDARLPDESVTTIDIGALHARLFLHSARKMLESMPPPATPELASMERGIFGESPRDIIIFWIHGIRHRVDATDALIELLRSEPLARPSCCTGNGAVISKASTGLWLI